MKYILAVLLFISSLSAFASGWTGYGTITELNQQPGTTSTDFYIKATLPNNSSGCTDTSAYMLHVETERDERVFSMLLTALMAGRQIKLYYTGECHAWNIAMVKGVYIK